MPRTLLRPRPVFLPPSPLASCKFWARGSNTARPQRSAESFLPPEQKSQGLTQAASTSPMEVYSITPPPACMLFALRPSWHLPSVLCTRSHSQDLPANTSFSFDSHSLVNSWPLSLRSGQGSVSASLLPYISLGPPNLPSPSVQAFVKCHGRQLRHEWGMEAHL